VVDRDLVRRRLLGLERYLGELGEITRTGREVYLSDWRAQRAVERTLQLAIEVCLDLAEHVIADRQLRVPESAADTFVSLRDAGLLDPALADSLVKMARFRNLLVHDYTRLDAGRVFDIASKDVDDVRRFAEAMRGLIG
jgi:uncharacterized protein YutE (UPF0331/DUF86 family)